MKECNYSNGWCLKFQMATATTSKYSIIAYAPISLLNPIAWSQFIQVEKEVTLKAINDIKQKYRHLFNAYFFFLNF